MFFLFHLVSSLNLGVFQNERPTPNDMEKWLIVGKASSFLRGPYFETSPYMSGLFSPIWGLKFGVRFVTSKSRWVGETTPEDSWNFMFQALRHDYDINDIYDSSHSGGIQWWVVL